MENDKICPECGGDGKRYFKKWLIRALNAYCGLPDDSEKYPDSVPCNTCKGKGRVPLEVK
jgi:DnaJ-class molecular chaperone